MQQLWFSLPEALDMILHFLESFLDIPVLSTPRSGHLNLDFRIYMVQGGSTFDYTCGCRDHPNDVLRECFLGHEQRNVDAAILATDCLAKSSPSGMDDFPPRFQMEAEYLAQRFETWFLNKRNSRRPYFAQISFRTAHNVFVASPELRKACANGTICNGEDLKSVQLDYGGVLYSMDLAIGRIRRLVRRNPGGNNTVLIFVSDNGPAPPPVGAGSAGDFRGNKGSLFEGLLHVPALIEWPKMIKSNRVSPSLLSIMDIPATIADILSKEGIPMDGISIFPFLKNDEWSLARPRDLGVCSFIDEVEIQQRTVCNEVAFYEKQGRWKIIATRQNARDSHGFANTLGKIVLYDLQSELGERKTMNKEASFAMIQNFTLAANVWLRDVFVSFRNSCVGYY